MKRIILLITTLLTLVGYSQTPVSRATLKTPSYSLINRQVPASPTTGTNYLNDFLSSYWNIVDDGVPATASTLTANYVPYTGSTKSTTLGIYGIYGGASSFTSITTNSSSTLGGTTSMTNYSTSSTATNTGIQNNGTLVNTSSVITPTLYGSSASGGNLLIQSTSDATKGTITLGASTGTVSVPALAVFTNNGTTAFTGPATFSSITTSNASTLGGNTSITTLNKYVFTQPSSGSTLTIADGKVLTQNNSLTYTGTDGSSVAFGTGGTVAYTSTLSSYIPYSGANSFTTTNNITANLITATSSVVAQSLVSNGTYNYNRNYLKDFDAQICKVQQATASSKVVIVSGGDSWGTGGFGLTYQPVAGYLKTQFNDAGIGYVAGAAGGASSSFGSNGLSATRVHVGSWTTTATYGTWPYSASLAADSTSTVGDSIYFVGIATDFVIHYMKKASGGSFVQRIDGTSPTTVSTSGSTGINYSSITGLTDGTHTISIKCSTAGSGILICGVEINRNQNGVRWHNISASGSTSQNWIQQDSTNWTSAINQLAPNMFVFMIGVNDRTANMTTTSYVGYLQRVINRVLAVKPNCSIVLFSQSDVTTATTYAMSTYVAAAKAFALANNYGFIDNWSLIGDYATANTRGLYANTLHINSIGGQVLADNFNTYLMSGIQMVYSNGLNTSTGINALANSVASGTANVAYGFQSLKANTTGNLNSAYGYNSLLANTTGVDNSAFGYNALTTISTNNDCSAFGYTALQNNTAIRISAFGSKALPINSTGGFNNAFGYSALNLNTTGNNNTAMGSFAGSKVATTSDNSAFGQGALQNATTGDNTAIGSQALKTCAAGDLNTAVGSNCLEQISGGAGNTAIGYYAGFSNVSGNLNTYAGKWAGYNNTGSGNLHLGYYAGFYLTTHINRVTLNTINRTTAAKDSTDSPIYIYEHATPASQRVYLNAQVFVANPFTASSTATISGNAVATSTLTGALLATSLTQTATLDFASTIAGAVSDLTVTVTGAALNDPVDLGAPAASVPAGGNFFAWVSATNVVTVRYADNSLVTTYDPASGTYTIKVWKN